MYLLVLFISVRKHAVACATEQIGWNLFLPRHSEVSANDRAGTARIKVHFLEYSDMKKDIR